MDIPRHQDAIRNYFLRTKQTIAVAESVTSGALQMMLSEVPDAAQFFQGGITAYNLGQKYKHLGVEPIGAQRCNCVSDEVAAQMALQVCTLFASDWGIGVTGYNTAVPEGNHEIYCHYAVACRGEIKSSGKLPAQPAPPAEIQTRFAHTVLHELITLF